MSEARKYLNIKEKISAKNLLLLVLVTVVIAIVGIIAKSMRGAGTANMVNIAQAQGCWTAPPIGGCAGTSGESASAEGAGGGGASAGCEGGSCC